MTHLYEKAVLALETVNTASQNQKLGPPAAENSLRHQRPHDLQPEQLPSGFHKAAGLKRLSHHTRGLKAALASGTMRWGGHWALIHKTGDARTRRFSRF